jgi:glutamate dehydrogenase
MLTRTAQVQIDAYRPAADALQSVGVAILSPFEREVAAARARTFVDAGAPDALAAVVAALRPMTAAVPIADLAHAAKLEPVSAGRLYHAVGGVFGFDRLRAAAAAIQPSDPYERRALRGLIVALIGEQLSRAKAIAEAPGQRTTGKRKARSLADTDAVIDAWIAPRRPLVERARRIIADIEGGGSWTFAKLTIATAALKEAAAVR